MMRLTWPDVMPTPVQPPLRAEPDWSLLKKAIGNHRILEITFDRKVCDAEEMIKRATYVLYQHNARISGISKGRGLEQRVMELTDQ